MDRQILIGWAEESITPEQQVMLSGQFFDRFSERVETSVTATAMAIDTGGEGLVICSCDLLQIDTGLLASVREKVCSQTELKPEQIIINATHTHTSLLYDSPAQTGINLNIFEKYFPLNTQKQIPANCMSGKEAFAFLTKTISAAICGAWDNRKPGGFANAFGRAAVGMCRRVVYDDGSAKMWGDTNSANFAEIEGGNDSGIELLYIFNDKEILTGVVANIACPSQVVEQRSFISSDYWGKVKILLRQKLGSELFVLGLCAPAGDQCPRDMIRWVSPESPVDDPHIHRENPIERTADPSMFDISGTWTVGRRIANEIIYTYEEVKNIRTKAQLIHKTVTLDLPLRRVTPEEVSRAEEVLEGYLQTGIQPSAEENAAGYVHAGTLERAEVQQRQNLHPIEIHIFRLGDIVFATNPFELFLDYGNLIRARSKARQTFLIQLSCGSSGYLPTLKAEQGGHYSAYISSGFVGHEGGDLLVRKTLEEINGLMANKEVLTHEIGM